MQKAVFACLAGLLLAGPAAAGELSGQGVIKAVDAGRGVVNIAHEPIPALKWPAMTMDFPLKDKKLAAGVTAGQKRAFVLEKDAARGYVITRFEPVGK